MLLVDWEIKQLLQENVDLFISPFHHEQIGPASVDLRLGDESIKFKPNHLFNVNTIVDIDTSPKPITHFWNEDEIIRSTAVSHHILAPKEFGLFGYVAKYLLISS